jgi:hypothetical protein
MYDENLKSPQPAFEPDWGVYQNSNGNAYTPKYKLSW